MSKKIKIDGLKDLEYNTSFFKLICDVGYTFLDKKGELIDKMKSDYDIKGVNVGDMEISFQGLFDGKLDLKINGEFIQGQFSVFDTFDGITHKTKKVLDDLIQFLNLGEIKSFGRLHSSIFETEDLDLITNFNPQLPEGIKVGTMNMNYEPKNGEKIKINTSMIKGKIKRNQPTDLKMKDLREIQGLLFEVDYIIVNGDWKKSLDTIKNSFSHKDTKILSLLRKIIIDE